MPPLVPCDQQAKRATSKRSSKEPKRAYIHNYHDHLGDPLYEQPMESTYNNRGGVQVTFPEKLFMMLDDAEEQDFASIVSWQPHGRCFVVHKPREFVEMVLPK